MEDKIKIDDVKIYTTGDATIGTTGDTVILDGTSATNIWPLNVEPLIPKDEAAKEIRELRKEIRSGDVVLVGLASLVELKEEIMNEIRSLRKEIREMKSNGIMASTMGTEETSEAG